MTRTQANVPNCRIDFRAALAFREQLHHLSRTTSKHAQPILRGTVIPERHVNDSDDLQSSKCLRVLRLFHCCRLGVLLRWSSQLSSASSLPDMKRTSSPFRSFLNIFLISSCPHLTLSLRLSKNPYRLWSSARYPCNVCCWTCRRRRSWTKTSNAEMPSLSLMCGETA